MASNSTFGVAVREEDQGAVEALEHSLHLDEEVPWYRQLELVVTLVFAVGLGAGIVWHMATINEWAEESLHMVELAAMESAQYAQAKSQKAEQSDEGTQSPKKGLQNKELQRAPSSLTGTSSRVVDGAKAVAGAGVDTVLFAPRALVSAGVSLKYRLHNIIDNVVHTAESLSPKWRYIWMLGDLVILGLAMSVLMFLPGSFLLLFVAWTAFIVGCDGGDSDAHALDIITDMVASADMAAVAHIGARSRDTAVRVKNPLLESPDLEDDAKKGSSGDGGNLLAGTAESDVLFAGQKSDRVTRDEARALHTMLRLQQEQYAKQREEEQRKLALAERRKAAQKLFDETDVDGNGTLDVEELHDLAKQMGVNLTLEQAQQAFDEIDTDTSGEIDFDEFFVFYETHMAAPGGLKAGFGNFFSGFKNLFNSKPISKAHSTGTSVDNSNKKLASLKQGRMTSSSDDKMLASIVRPIDHVRQHFAMPSVQLGALCCAVSQVAAFCLISCTRDSTLTFPTENQADYFDALVKGINKMAYQRVLGMVDTNGDGIANAVAYDTRGDGYVSRRTHSDSDVRGWLHRPTCVH